MIRRPPRSTPFPTRRSSDLLKFHLAPGGKLVVNVPAGKWLHSAYDEAVGHLRRSEEHTSELQSQSNLVCRLLLEKKKTKVGGHPKTTFNLISNIVSTFCIFT